MKTWYDVELEDIQKEVIPGVKTIDKDVINKLNWQSYLERIGDLIEMGVGQDIPVVKDQIENVMVDVLIEAHRVMGQDGPEPDDIQKFLKDPENILTKQNLTFLCINSTPETWPDILSNLREELGLND